MRVTRFDLHRLDAVEVMADGTLRAPARVARVGVLEYEDAAGNRWGELVPPETLFAADSMATLRGVALTDLHPGALVTPATRQSVAVGHASDDVKRDGNFLAVPLYVTDAAEIALVNEGKRKDLSSGYTCNLDETPGVFDGVPYKRVQRDRVYNHVGLGPAGWGRAGSEVALRMDGAAMSVTTGWATARVDSRASAMTGTHAPAKGNEMKIKIGGREYKLDDAAEMAAAQKKVDDVEGEAAKTPDLTASLDAATKALMDAMATIARMKAELVLAQAVKPAVGEADVPEAVADSLVSTRLKSLDTAREAARKVLPATVKLDGLFTAAAVRAAVVAHYMPETKLDGLDARVVEGMYTAIVGAHEKQAAKRADGNSKLVAVLVPDAEQAAAVAHEDAAGAETDDPVEAQRKALKKWGSAPIGASQKAVSP